VRAGIPGGCYWLVYSSAGGPAMIRMIFSASPPRRFYRLPLTSRQAVYLFPCDGPEPYLTRGFYRKAVGARIVVEELEWDEVEECVLIEERREHPDYPGWIDRCLWVLCRPLGSDSASARLWRLSPSRACAQPPSQPQQPAGSEPGASEYETGAAAASVSEPVAASSPGVRARLERG